ncbi:GNAT family N-acetyltransferase [Aquimarina mytili]|uniref:GNAT family N-acetyltransferase n=1 Tax=Aquimarina mytili TaxID=874423 RepID=A0A936ZQK6_9FLAO|nr:GNAT family N-acetyltransferase [Aquimarina mytili]MBL0682893.1 GNAT family N-acetyltransferase [Aquimarina mytili]
MKIRRLDIIEFSVLMECFLKAFENYFVKMPTDHEYYRQRWEMAKVRLDLSYGMFYDEKLVGFIINAIDQRQNDIIAFNTGTGVLPEFRRQNIVHSIYQFAIPELRKHGVTKCQLEVIKENIVAIKAYKKIGFHCIKNYKCYNGDIILNDTLSSDVELKRVNTKYFDWNTLDQNTYSWDNHFNTISRGKYEYYAVLFNNTLDSYFVVNPLNRNLAQFNTLKNTTDNWTRLFAAIQSISKTIKINNVDESLTEKIDFLNKIKLKNTVNQYEMELYLN